MAILKKSAIASFIAAPPADTKVVLVYGPDAGRVHEVATGIVRTVAGSQDDPFLVVKVTDNSLAADPALLADEARSMSLTGGRRVIWVAPAARGFQGAIESYLADPGGDGLIVAEAGALQKSAKLRTLLEKSGEAAVIACYEDSAEDLRALVRRAASEAGLTVDDGVVEHVVERIGSDRSLSRREIEKLVLYCYGNESIELADVEAVCGDVSAASLDALLDATFGGDVAECCRRLAQLEESGTTSSGILTSTGSHLARLQELRSEIDRGKPRDQVVRSARPPIHFARQSGMARQLALWSGSALDGAVGTILEATALTRQYATLDHAITERALLSLARRARTMRARSAA
ncbi:MAG: DNA polymerase III subunit delta [Hyphomicrobiales bacterium]